MKTERRAILQLRQATFRLGDKRVFPQTDWTLRLGEHWAVTGPTAAGKTIFARALRGDLPLVAGAIEYDFPPVPRREPEDQIECLLADGSDFDTVAGASSRWFSLDQEESLLTRECLEWSAVENINPFEVVAAVARIASAGKAGARGDSLAGDSIPSRQAGAGAFQWRASQGGLGPRFDARAGCSYSG